MLSSIRALARPLLMFTALVLLIATLIQPATSSLAQAGDPPPSPTAVPPPDRQPQTAGNPISITGYEQAKADPQGAASSSTAHQQLQKPTTASPFPVANSTSQGTTPSADIVRPTAQDPNSFRINTVASATVAADGLLTYSIYFTNSTSITYQNVILQNGIGSGQRYTGCEDAATCPFTYTGNLDIPRPTIISGFGNGGSYDPRQMVWNLGTVQPGRNGRISYTVRVWRELYPQTERLPTILGNTVALYDGGAINTDHKLNEDQWGVLIVGPIFDLTKAVDKQFAQQGERVSYTISLGNKTNSNDASRPDAITAHNIQLVDVLPPTLDPTSIQFPAEVGSIETHGSDTWVVWNYPTLAIGQSFSRRFSAVVKNTLTECNSVDNYRYYATSAEFPLADDGSHYYIPGRNNARTGIPMPVTIDVQLATAGTIYVGDTVSYVVNVNSYWDSPITGAEIVFYLPSAFSYVANSASSNGLYDPNSNTVTWSNVSLPARTDFFTPGLKQFTLQGRAGRKIHVPPENIAHAQVTKLPGVPMGCLRIFNLGVDVQPLLYANKTVEPSNATVLSGTEVIYTINLLNISAQPLTNVSLIDNIPNPLGGPFGFNKTTDMLVGTPPSSATSTQITWNGNLTVPAGSLSVPGRTTLQFKMTVRGIPDQCPENHIFPSSPASEANDVVSGRVCIAFPWIVTKTVDKTSISPRDTDPSQRRLEFTLTYKSLVGFDVNMTPKDEFRVQAGNYPYEWDGMISGPAGPLNTIPDGSHRLNWPAIVLHGHETIVYKFAMKLPLGPDNLIPTGTYCNEGILQPNEPQYPYTVYTRPDACTAVSSIEMHVGKWVDRHDVGLGEQVIYGVDIFNNSDDTVSGLVVSDTLPVNVVYVKPGPSSLAPTVTELPNGRQLLRWENITPVSGHSKATVSFQVRAPGLIGSYRNVAEVTGGNPAPAFTCDYGLSPTGGCQGVADLNVFNFVTIDPQPTPASAQPGDIVTYTVSLVSNNTIPYLNTTVTDTLPLGFTFVEMVNGPAPYRLRPDVLIWTNQIIPQRDGNNPGRLTYVFRAKAPLSYGSFRSRVEASSPTGIIPTVDNAGRVLIVPPNPALSLVAPTLVQIGSDVTFRISLVNPLASPLTGVTINHVLPDGFVFKSVAAGTPAPTTNGQTLTWSNVTVPEHAQDGTPGIVELVVIATAPNTEGTATSTVTASGGSTAIDQTYNKVDLIIAQLRYTFLPFASTPG